MIKFRQKNFTIQEGHFTGTKDEDKLPSTLEVVGKSALGGAIIGGIVGKIDKKITVKDGALQGTKYGALTGIAIKLLINHLHKPMSKVKYQEVDKGIRREFGIYKAAGITLGDKLDKRANMEERFAFNDRNVCSYKINFAIQDNKVTMYTNNLTDQELEKLNKHLDYYCKNYYGMSYTAMAINSKTNTYSVGIVFTNYQVISNFMVELSNILETKINLLDSNSLVKGRLVDSTIDQEERSFSVQPLNKYDYLKALGKTGIKLTVSALVLRKLKFKSLSSAVMSSIGDTCKTITAQDMRRLGIKVPRSYYGNTYLEDTLKKLHFVEGFNYSVSEKDSPNNISMTQGLFIVTLDNDKDNIKQVDDKYWKSFKNKINRSEINNVIVYTYSINSTQEFESLLRRLMSTGIKFNIFEG